MRLFTALWPSTEAIEHLSAAVEKARSVPALADITERARGFRFVPVERWHLTLCFHGEADPQWFSDRLDRRIARLTRKMPVFAPPRLRMTGVGLFRGVLWVGVEAASDDDKAVLQALVRAAGANPHDYRGHLTVARWGAGGPDRAGLTGLFDHYTGPWWSASEITLVVSEQHRGQPVYRCLHSVPLGSVPSGG